MKVEVWILATDVFWYLGRTVVSNNTLELPESAYGYASRAQRVDLLSPAIPITYNAARRLQSHNAFTIGELQLDPSSYGSGEIFRFFELTLRGNR